MLLLRGMTCIKAVGIKAPVFREDSSSMFECYNRLQNVETWKQDE